MDKVMSQQDQVVSQETGDRRTGIRTQVELEAENTELRNLYVRERNLWDKSIADYEQRLQEKNKQIKQHQKEVEELAGQVVDMQLLALKAWGRFDRVSDALATCYERSELR